MKTPPIAAPVTAQPFRVVVGSLLLLFLASAAAAQCESSTGAGGDEGMNCIEVYAALTPDAAPTEYVYANPLQTSERAVLAQIPIPPGATTTLTDLQSALSRVTYGRVILVTDGEFRQAVTLVRPHGFDTSHPLKIGLNYRSYVADLWRQAGDGVGTFDDPFGPGWRASWGDLLASPPANLELGALVTRIDEHGSAWIHAAESFSEIEEEPGFSPGPTLMRWVLSARGGVRLIREDRTINGQAVPHWFKEWPDRTRLEYFAPSGSGSLVAKRIYRGSYVSPDWQVTFTYTGDRLHEITDAGGITHNLTWTSFGSTSRVTTITTHVPSSWTP